MSEATIKIGRLYKKKNDDRNHIYVVSKLKRPDRYQSYKVIYILQHDTPTANDCVTAIFDDLHIRMYYELVEDS